MLYAKVTVGLPVEGPFDYSVPAEFNEKIKIGARVWVSFRAKKIVGFVVDLTKKTAIKNIKPLLEIIDDFPILDKNILLLAKKLSDYYCCSWGEAIETALPDAIRKGKPLADINPNFALPKEKDQSLSIDKDIPRDGKILPDNTGNYIAPYLLPSSLGGEGWGEGVFLVHDLSRMKRWDIYIEKIKENIALNKSTIILLPDINSVFNAEKIISGRLSESSINILYRKQPSELQIWTKVKKFGTDILIGTRSSIFAPLKNLGLIIIDEEQDSVYKQDQIPHYHAREVAFMRMRIEKTGLILGSSSPSLETFYLSKKSKIKYIFIPKERNSPEIKIIDMKSFLSMNKRKNIIFSKYLEDSIRLAVSLKEKVLLFINRTGFAAFAYCHSCGVHVKCPRCDINLTYHFKDNILNCHYCNFKIPPPKICPVCNSGYIRYFGAGTEKIESELARLFPQARIKQLDNPLKIKSEETDIFIATESIIKEVNLSFSLVGVLSIDTSLNRIDFRSTEKTFALLIGLFGMAEKKIVFQTNLAKHHSFQALTNNDINFFYQKELKYRKELFFPPYKHLALVKLRGKDELKVSKTAEILFKTLKDKIGKKIDLISLNRGQPSKLRGNFYWQILLRGNSPRLITKSLKIHLKKFPHSGIILTVDIDPI